MKKLNVLFWTVVFLAIISRCIVALHFETRAWIDEVWVVLNPAFRMLTGVGFMERDWSWQVRDYLPPTLVFLILKTFKFSDGFEAIHTLRICMALANLFSIILFIKLLGKKFSLANQPWLAALIVFFIPDLIHYAPTYDLSVFGTPFLLCGICGIFWNEERQDHLFWIGSILLCLSCLIRFQFGIFPVVFCLGFLLQGKLKRFVSLFTLGLFVILSDIVFNSWKYGNFVFPIYNYFIVNTKGGVAASYGVTPFYAGFEIMWKWITEPVFLLIVIFIPFYLKRFSIVGFASLIYIMMHISIGHKEYRFFYTSAVTLACLGSVSFQKWFEMKKSKNILISFLILFLSFALFRGFKKTDWHAYEIPAKLETLAGTKSNLTGLITVGWGGIYQGGNFFVYRPVPYVFAEDFRQLKDKKLNPSDFSHLVLPENITSPCINRISSERGGSLYLCSKAELESIL